MCYDCPYRGEPGTYIIDQTSVLTVPRHPGRPSAETRAELVKEVNKLCENARVSIRSARHSAQKQIKSDEKNKVVGKSEAAGEMKKVSGVMLQEGKGDFFVHVPCPALLRWRKRPSVARQR